MRLLRLILPALLLLNSCTSEDVHETRFMMGTLVEFTLSDSDTDQARAAIAAAAAEMVRVEQQFTIYGLHDNAVKRFNHSAVDSPVRLPAEVSTLLQIATEVQQQSHHAFHPALATWNRLWGFSQDPPPAAPPEARHIAVARPGLSCLQYLGERRWLRHTQNCQLDFGAIAKGYAIDRGMAVLQQHGIRHAIINAGGDMRIIGNHHGKPWQIGIRHPRHKGGIIGYVRLQGDASIVTSGDYERFYIYRGKRYHHILDPHTGYPARRVQSATVIATNATRADAWSTALFVMGKQGLPLLQQQHMPALITDQQGELHLNHAMNALFHAADDQH